MDTLPNGWVPTSAVPLMFGPEVSCGNDEITGPIYQPMYGPGQNNRLLFTLNLEAPQSSMQIAIPASQIGSPTTPITLTLQDNLGTLLATASLSPSQVPTAEGWTAFAIFTPAGPISSGQYLLTATAPNATSTDCYQVYFNIAGSEWVTPADRAGYTGPPGYGNSGYSTIWVKDSNGNNLLVYPIGYTYDTGFATQFTALSAFPFNAILLWISDQDFVIPPTSATFSLIDTTTGQTLGTSTASIYKMSHGIQGLEIFPFDNSVVTNTIAGHSYSLSVSDPSSIYQPYPRGSSITPPVAGASVYNLGGLALIDPTPYRILDYGGVTITTQTSGGVLHGGVGGTDGVCVRIVPKFTDTITSVMFKTSTALGGGTTKGYYPSGYPVTLSQYNSKENLGPPLYATPGTLLATAPPIDSGVIPLNSWIVIDNVNFPVTAGVPCWLQLNAPTASGSLISLERCVNSWRNLALTVTSGKYDFFGQGPTDLDFAAFTSHEVIGSPHDISVALQLSSTQLAAQPFILSNPITISSLFVMMSGATQTWALYPDGGSGPNVFTTALAGGTGNGKYAYTYSGLPPIAASVPASLSANVKYWIVLSGNATANCALYWMRPVDPPVPQGYDCLISNDGGLSWNLPTNFQGNTVAAASLLFIVGALPSGTPPPLTPVTISLQVTQA